MWKEHAFGPINEKNYPTAFYLNFEDPRLYGFTVEDFQKIDRLVNEQKHTELLFDEIQVVAGWERYIRQKLDQGNHQIVITGSNASLLSKELGTKLTGRHITKELFPFSYGQFCAIKELPKSPESTSPSHTVPSLSQLPHSLHITN